MFGAVLLDEVFKLVVREDNRVEIEPLQIRRRHPIYLLAAVGARRCRMVDAAGISRQIAAAMGDDELQIGVVVKHTAEDQMMDGDGRIEWVANDIDEVMVGKPPRLGKAGRVHEDEKSEFLDAGEHLAESLGREILAGDIGRDLDAAETERFV